MCFTWSPVQSNTHLISFSLSLSDIFVDIMKYALKGTDEDWANALKDKGDVNDGSTVQIKHSKEVRTKRKADDSAAHLDKILKSENKGNNNGNSAKKSKSKKKSRKTIG